MGKRVAKISEIVLPRGAISFLMTEDPMQGFSQGFSILKFDISRCRAGFRFLYQEIVFPLINQTDSKRPISQVAERVEIVGPPRDPAAVDRVDEVKGYVAAQQVDVVDRLLGVHGSNIVSGNVLGKSKL